MNEPKAVSLIAIHAHGIPTDFPREAVDEAQRAKPVTASAAAPICASMPLITIDPEDARDHDDAVWAGPDTDPSNQGGHIVIVAIADVAHYVTSGSALDREAEKRGNSVYFPDRVVPMLPEELSADLCSLRENEDRPCLAVRMMFDARGVKRRHEFLRGVMRSAARLTYAQAQARVRRQAGRRKWRRSTIASCSRCGRRIARCRSRASERSPLDLDLPERRIIIGEDGKISSIAFRERLESMRLIEEFMIMANVAAAETLRADAHAADLSRARRALDRRSCSRFSDYLRTIGIPFAKGQVMKPAVFNRILERARGTPHQEVINDVVLRTQAQAVYAPDNVGHFGLNLARYAHFTSPIRRYADLVVHRALIRARNLGDDGLSDAKIARLEGDRRSHLHDRAPRHGGGARFRRPLRRGLYAGSRRRGVRRPHHRRDAVRPVPAIGGYRRRRLAADARARARNFFRHDEKRHALVGERTKTIYRLGETMTVRLAEAAPLTGGLRFELADDEENNAAAVTRRNIPRARKGRR